MRPEEWTVGRAEGDYLPLPSREAPATSSGVLAIIPIGRKAPPLSHT